MTSTVITSTTVTYTVDSDTTFELPPMGGQFGGLESFDIGEGGGNGGWGYGQYTPPPPYSASSSGGGQNGLAPDAFMDGVMNGALSPNRPADYDATKTIGNFQNERDTGPLNKQQLQQMADEGTYTDPEGNTHKVSKHVQHAAQQFMDNNAELYNKLAPQSQGSQGGGNGLPSEASAVNTIENFQKNNNIALLSDTQMKEIADTGYYTGQNGQKMEVDPQVQAAAEKYMANGGAMFNKMEAENNGQHDGLLGISDADVARNNGDLSTASDGDYGNGDNGNGNYGGQSQYMPPGDYGAPPPYTFGNGGNNLPSEASAANTIENFQKNNNIGLLSDMQMKEIADTGYYTGKNGQKMEVGPQVQAAAEKYMANGGAMFKQMEAENNGRHDGLLGISDADVARNNGDLSTASGGDYGNGDNGNGNYGGQSQYMPPGGYGAPPSYTSGNGGNNLPSEASAANTIEKFQKNAHTGLLSDTQMKEIADTGYYINQLGMKIKVEPEVQAAAEKYMANGGAMFKQMEAENNGRHDGLLGISDADAARNNGYISA